MIYVIIFIAVIALICYFTSNSYQNKRDEAKRKKDWEKYRRQSQAETERHFRKLYYSCGKHTQYFNDNQQLWLPILSGVQTMLDERVDAYLRDHRIRTYDFSLLIFMEPVKHDSDDPDDNTVYIGSYPNNYTAGVNLDRRRVGGIWIDAKSWPVEKKMGFANALAIPCAAHLNQRYGRVFGSNAFSVKCPSGNAADTINIRRVGMEIKLTTSYTNPNYRYDGPVSL